jgi:hypothetical protein
MVPETFQPLAEKVGVLQEILEESANIARKTSKIEIGRYRNSSCTNLSFGLHHPD